MFEYLISMSGEEDPTRRSKRPTKGKPPHRYGQDQGETPKQNVVQRVIGSLFGSPQADNDDARSTVTSASSKSKKSAVDAEVLKMRENIGKEIRDRKLQNVQLKKRIKKAKQEFDVLKEMEDKTDDVKNKMKELQEQIDDHEADIEANEIYLEDLAKDLENLAEKHRIAKEVIDEEDNESQKLSEDEDNLAEEEDEKDAAGGERGKGQMRLKHLTPQNNGLTQLILKPQRIQKRKN